MASSSCPAGGFASSPGEWTGVAPAELLAPAVAVESSGRGLCAEVSVIVPILPHPHVVRHRSPGISRTIDQ